MEVESEMKDFDALIYEKQGKIASITLNRPEKHNALNYLSVPRAELEGEVSKLADEIAEIPRDGALHSKIAMNADLKILGVDALFDYYGQMNRYTRFINTEQGSSHA